uniref:Ovule protein n=1 Tax=Romanomermis culicivorax TaxID=13658 RepID=A0A915HUL7_ROMCU
MQVLNMHWWIKQEEKTIKLKIEEEQVPIWNVQWSITFEARFEQHRGKISWGRPSSRRIAAFYKKQTKEYNYL